MLYQNQMNLTLFAACNPQHRISKQRFVRQDSPAGAAPSAVMDQLAGLVQLMDEMHAPSLLVPSAQDVSEALVVPSID